MQKEKLKEVSINKVTFYLNGDETEIFYHDRWIEIQEDQDGDKYIMIGGFAKYLDKTNQPDNH